MSPDGFSATGQLWGNPLYDWDKMAEDDYAWWVGRIDYFCHIYDVLRIDHFRGFDSYLRFRMRRDSQRQLLEAGAWHETFQCGGSQDW